jgi:drug/metabolite transporter (DMT)-like permease
VHDLDGLFLGLLAALFWGSTDTLATVVSRRIGALRASAGAVLTTVVVLGALAIASGTGLPTEPWVVARALVCGVLSATAYLAFFNALRIGPLTVVSPVVSVYGSLTVVLSVLLLGESLRSGQVLGVVIATVGVLLISIVFDRDWRRTRVVGRGVAFAVVALILFAVVTVVLSGAIRAAGWLPVLLLARAANASTVLGVLGVSRWRDRGRALGPVRAPSSARAGPAALFAAVTVAATNGGPVGDPDAPVAMIPAGAAGGEVTVSEADLRAERASLDRRSLGLVVLVGMLDLGGFIALAIGLGVAPTWLVGLASSFGPVVAVAAGVALFGERPRATQWVGLGCVAASVVLIALG